MCVILARRDISDLAILYKRLVAAANGVLKVAPARRSGADFTPSFPLNSLSVLDGVLSGGV